MTTMSTPLPLAGSGAPSVPTPDRISDRAAIRKLGRIALNSLFVFSCLLVVLFLVLHAYVAWALSHPPVASIVSNPMLAKNLAYSEVTFPSADDKTLVDGWWIPSVDSRQTVVLSHGYGANREESWVPMYDLADLLHRLSYNVLMFDYGFASTAHKTPATGGIIESEQLLGALQFARKQGSDELIVWGFSMGAGTALQAGLHSAPVDAMILDSTFIPDSDTLYQNVRNYLDIPRYPSIAAIRWFFPLMSGNRLEQIPAQEIQETAYDFPIFLIHGTADDKAPAYLSENVAKAQTNSLSQIWIVPDAIHEMIYRTHTDEYVRRTTSFLERVHTEVLAKASTAEPSVA
ncbi:alpha/beta hydrolase [Cohnella lupini]|uniref:Alpha/beta hydrolase family protein n=1 Tax=Cohnella lupini TaxID=1294267 RepID=A0A3D9IPW2_9BACL|nr:alpha/beta hydrolase [Cohnella lupini]RED63116.1 alpha/beta hydrolase family protein [Cohnella lupini]